MPATDPSPPLELRLLGGFELLRDGTRVPVSVGSRRLLAFLALRGRAASRRLVAGALWPEVSEVKALANLRAALTRLGPTCRQALEVAGADLAVAACVTIDLRDAQRLAARILEPADIRPQADRSPCAVANLSGQLLPCWYDDWAVLAAEDWQQLRVRALEVLAAELAAARRYAEAGVAARAAVRADPLRESARAALIAIHIADGDRCAAVREFTAYDVLLHAELGLRPSAPLRAVIATLTIPEPVDTEVRGAGRRHGELAVQVG